MIKTNVKTARIFVDGKCDVADIYIEGGIIRQIRDDIKHSMFSGVYELDAEGLMAVPTFTDSGCFCLGSKTTGEELPIISTDEYKRLGFYSFITSLNISDKKERLINQKKQVSEYNKENMCVKFLSGGMKDRAYHLNQDIYTDVVNLNNCAGASVIYDDAYGSIDHERIDRLCRQVDAAAQDTNKTGIVYLYIGDLSLDFSDISDFISKEFGREKTIVPWFCNRGQRILDSSIDYVKKGGRINLVAGGKREEMSEDFIPLSDSLMAIYESLSSLDGVLVSSLSGGYLPKKDDKTPHQRGAVHNIYKGVKKAVSMGLPIHDALKVLCFNPIDLFGFDQKKIKKAEYANFLIIDDKLNIKYIIDGQELIQPKNFRDVVLFI